MTNNTSNTNNTNSKTTRTYNGRQYYLYEYHSGMQHPNSPYGAPVLRIFPSVYARQKFIDDFTSNDWSKHNIKTVSAPDAKRFYRKGDKWRNGTMRLDIITGKWLYYNSNINDWSDKPW